MCFLALKHRRIYVHRKKTINNSQRSNPFPDLNSKLHTLWDVTGFESEMQTLHKKNEPLERKKALR